MTLPSLNDVMAQGEGVKQIMIFDDEGEREGGSEIMSIHDEGGEGVRNHPKIDDVIYGRPLVDCDW